MVDRVPRWNVPGNVSYNADKPTDYTLTSTHNAVLRGYWLARDRSGQLYFCSNNSAEDDVTIEYDGDIPQIVVSGDPKDFQWNPGRSEIRIRIIS